MFPYDKLAARSLLTTEPPLHATIATVETLSAPVCPIAQNAAPLVEWQAVKFMVVHVGVTKSAK
jgi:hypothetical protein